ncbi:MAG: hypothetical protein HYU88_05370 [Chloroflexi bacterium]|nr:hypothetical protein [Chloroflexota bacterium]MBI4506458.1 hypothetical protein [Chloroflexota bacterium]
MTQDAFWSAAWAEALRACINCGRAPEERAQIRRPEAYWQAIDRGRQTFGGSLVLGIRDVPRGQSAYLTLAFDGGACTAARLGAQSDGAEPRYVLAGTQADWQAMARDGNLLRGIMYGTLRLDAGDPIAFFKDICFFLEVLACLARVPTTFADGAAA